MLLQYPNANSVEKSPMAGKNECGFDECLNIVPTLEGSNLDTQMGIAIYF